MTARSQQQMVEAATASQFTSLQSDLYILLSDPSYKTLEAFSSNEWHRPTRQTKSSTMGSLEDLHGSIHVAVGGTMGHMSQLQYSAFDPIFWLHHANVDRLFAIWQALNPNAYDINKVETDGTFSIRGGTSVTPDTPLAPFNDASGRKFWTSNTSKKTESFNYAYPETQRWKFSTDSLYITSVRQAVFSLYGGVSRVFRQGESAPNILMATAQSLQPGIAAQKPLQDTQKPVSAAAAQNSAGDQSKPTAPSSASKPSEIAHGTGIFSQLGSRIKDAISGDHQPKDGTRGLDLESEIGKRKQFHSASSVTH